MENKKAIIKVVSGGYLDILNPDLDLINLEDISIALARLPRYSGQLPEFIDHYSVAEHTCIVYDLAKKDNVDKEVLKAILLHDASEAYMNDLISPIKNLCPEYKEIEDNFTAKIYQKFDVDYGHTKTLVKYYDLLALKAEKQKFWPEDDYYWETLQKLPDIEVFFTFDTWRNAKEKLNVLFFRYFI